MRVQKLALSAAGKRPVALILIALAVALCGNSLFPSRSAAQQSTNDLLTRAFAQSGETNDAAAKALRAGRDLIEQERWPEAAKRFAEIVAVYPRHSNIDMALYWQAFALKKQGKLKDADTALARIIRDYPKSTWKDDAQAMRLEMAPQLGDQATIDRALEGGGDQSTDEMKVIALQSLVFSNPERALPVIQELLKPESKAGRNLKQPALAFLGQMGGGRGLDLLIDVARNHQEVELRRSAIFWVGQSPEDRAFDCLKEIVAGEIGSDTKNLLDATLFALGQNRNPRARAYLVEVARTAPASNVRQAAITNIGLRADEQAVDALLSLYESETNLSSKQQVLFALSSNGISARARAKLLDVARNDPNIELRKTAMFWIGQRPGEESLAQLIQLFDAEPDVSVKEHMLMVLSQSRSKTALQKLMEIAKTSQSLELRKRAVFWLGQSRDPEAKKFIEEILK